ncbi:MAG: DNA mismatch repair endonuclease MutL [Candidatus Eremiobacteraeota bacterium]|nr:DNA mismatch repair endonuclease MutL [Candidatus Eremiobacteraeota bacterium]
MIKLLDQQTIGQIAAGEVIERPLSVVKELVENSIDAGASRVDVRIEEGGLRSIQVGDDGEGIAAHQLALALKRHATSKLAAASDLEAIGTLGFRGEGLASIAAVSRVRVTSRKNGSDIGSAVEAFGETIGFVEPCSAAPGTIVEARDLFANVPVRREYVRSPAAEFRRISSWLSTFTLAYPSVTFSLMHDGKPVWVLPEVREPKQRLSAVFGKDAAAHLLPLQSDAARDLSGEVNGFISEPGWDRPDRRLQVLFVNGRLLRSTLLAGAWTAAYSTFAMTGRNPYGVLFLSLPPDHVDANVHPTKSDVRLRFGHQVFEAVRRAISTTLRAHSASTFRDAVSLSPNGIDTSLAHLQTLFEAAPHAEQEPSEYAGAPRMRVLGQIAQTYIVATDGRTLMLIDQHAAHERIAYESIMANAKTSSTAEPLLVPLTFELNGGESEALERAVPALTEGGLQIEEFGERSYRIVATPGGYGAREFDLRGFLEDVSASPGGIDVRERTWASLACHSVTRAGERLEPAEMASLIERLQLCSNPMHCPHGRPTLVRLDEDALAKLFKR